MTLRRFSMLGFGLVLLATPVQASSHKSTHGEHGEKSKGHDHHASSIQLEKTKPIRR